MYWSLRNVLNYLKDMTAKDLTPEQLAWFRENFDHTKNQELADHLGTSIRTVTRMARELGLWKTKEFVAAMQRNASEHGARATRLMGGNAGAVNLLKYGKAHNRGVRLKSNCKVNIKFKLAPTEPVKMVVSYTTTPSKPKTRKPSRPKGEGGSYSVRW